MYARSTTIVGDPARLDEGIAYVRDDVLPMVTSQDGCVGLSMLVDRDSGQCIVTSSWSSAETMRASDLHLAPLRARSSDIMGGPPEVAEWEVAVMHRDHLAAEGASCRVTWMRINHGDIERGIKLYRAAMLPEMETLDGFCSASLLVDRASGRAVSSVTYATRDAMERSREAAAAMRRGAVEENDLHILEVGEFELALAHLRVPETV